jgi:hypothetical protein
VQVALHSPAEQQHEMLPQLLKLLLPWTNHHTHHIRTFAQLGFCALLVSRCALSLCTGVHCSCRVWQPPLPLCITQHDCSSAFLHHLTCCRAAPLNHRNRTSPFTCLLGTILCRMPSRWVSGQAGRLGWAPGVWLLQGRWLAS